MAKKIILRHVRHDGTHADPATTPPPRPERPVDDILAEIRSLYFKTTARTIQGDFDRAIDLLKTIPLPEDRQRATVFMDGLAEMKKEWGGRRKRRIT
jgi:hypothetical protein